MARVDFQDNVVLLIGLTQQKFLVPRLLLNSVSSFFKAATDGRWLRNNTIQLPSDNAVIFNTFLQWAYTGEIVGETGGVESEVRKVMKLYVFADKLGATKLKNDTIDLIRSIEYADGLRQIEEFNFAFGNTADTSKLREYLIDEWLYLSNVAYVDEYFARLPLEMTKQVGKQLAKEKRKPRVYNHMSWTALYDKCYYHEHDDLAPKCCS